MELATKILNLVASWLVTAGLKNKPRFKAPSSIYSFVSFDKLSPRGAATDGGQRGPCSPTYCVGEPIYSAFAPQLFGKIIKKFARFARNYGFLTYLQLQKMLEIFLLKRQIASSHFSNLSCGIPRQKFS